METEFESEQASYAAWDATDVESTACEEPEEVTSGDQEHDSLSVLCDVGSTHDGIDTEMPGSMESRVESTLTDKLASETTGGLAEADDDLEIGNFFSEDNPANESLSIEVHNLQKKDKLRELLSEKNLEKLGGIWKKVTHDM